MQPYSLIMRLMWVTLGTACWWSGRQARFDADRWLLNILALFFVIVALCDVVLWWPY